MTAVNRFYYPTKYKSRSEVIALGIKCIFISHQKRDSAVSATPKQFRLKLEYNLSSGGGFPQYLFIDKNGEFKPEAIPHNTSMTTEKLIESIRKQLPAVYSICKINKLVMIVMKSSPRSPFNLKKFKVKKNMLFRYFLLPTDS